MSSVSSRRKFLQNSAAAAITSRILRTRGAAQDSKFVIAATTFGKVRGITNNGIQTFKGIPYGATTAGANRFMPPADPMKWTGIRDALEYGHSAPQRDPAAPPPSPGALSVSGASLPVEGEDCLVLNGSGPLHPQRQSQTPRYVLVPWRR